MNNKEVIQHIKLILLRSRAGKLNIITHGEEIALNLAIKALHIIDIINEELSPADEDKAVWFDIPYWEEIQERANKM